MMPLSQRQKTVTICPFILTQLYRHRTDRQTVRQTELVKQQHRVVHALHADAR